MSKLREYLRSLIITIFMVSILTEFFVQAFKDSENSMAALLSDCEPNGHYLVLKFIYMLDGPKRGDLVLFRSERYNEVIISRVIGLPGEKLTIENGQILINSKRMVEESVLTQAAFDMTTVVPAGRYFVLPDRRSGPLSGSAGSQIWGPIARTEILGRLWFAYWPIRAFGLVKRPQYSF